MMEGRQALVPIPQELTTLKGMAEHLALMAEASSQLRNKAAEWFQGTPEPMQLDLIRSVSGKPDRMRLLLGLVPDATALLCYLGLPLVRRVCDGSAGFLSAVEPTRTLEIVRQTANAGARREWLQLVHEAYADAPERFDEFIANTSGAEIAGIFVDLFGYRDLELLESACDDVGELDGVLDDAYRFVQELYLRAPSVYQDMIAAIETLIYTRYELRSRLRTLDELQRRWPGYWRDVHAAGEPGEVIDDEEPDDVEEDDEEE